MKRKRKLLHLIHLVVLSVLTFSCSETEVEPEGIESLASTSSGSGLPSIGDIISLKASNGKYVSARPSEGKKLKAAQTYEGSHEKFEIVNAGSGLIALKNIGTGKYVNFPGNANHALVADRTSIGGGEKASIVAGKNSGQLAIRADNTNNFICNESNGNDYVKANRTNIGTWESFTFNVISGGGTGSCSDPLFINSTSSTLDKSSNTKLRVFNWNVQSSRAFDAGRQRSWERIAKAMDAEILIMQEVDDDHNGGKYTADFFTSGLEEDTGLSGWNMSWDNKDCAVFTRYPILKTIVPYPGNGGDDTRAVISYIDLPCTVSDRGLVIMNVHLPKNSEDGKRRVTDDLLNIRDQIQRGNYPDIDPDAHFIFAGDFNSQENHYVHNTLEAAGLKDDDVNHWNGNQEVTWGDIWMNGNGSVSQYQNTNSIVDRIHYDMPSSKVENAFVLNTFILTDAQATKYGMLRTDVARDGDDYENAANAGTFNINTYSGKIDCDHFPVVMDFKYLD